MDLMSAEGKKKFIEISEVKEPKPANRFFVPASVPAAEEPQASRKRRADEAGMAPNIMASYG